MGFILIRVFANMRSLFSLDALINGGGYLIGIMLALIIICLFSYSLYLGLKKNKSFVAVLLLSLWVSLLSYMAYGYFFFGNSAQNIKLIYTIIISAYLLRSKFIDREFFSKKMNGKTKK